ncbi:MAG TPA: hypothetical protein VJU86_22210 [Pyrinomonadaceae bacterium]|nr:hypothetical protein [Pyrinomonadaceae bacterium]
MNRNIKELERDDDGIALEEPHFDEAATVLSARPVVPLAEVERESRLGGVWAAGVIVVALVLGALGATLVYTFRGEDPATSSANADDQAEPSSPLLEAGVAAIASETPLVSTSPEPLAEAPTQPAKASAPSAAVKRTPVRSGVSERQRDESEILERRQQEKEIRIADKRERRRERRAEREARRNQGERSDDLLRIREIFEGSPRP